MVCVPVSVVTEVGRVGLNLDCFGPTWLLCLATCRVGVSHSESCPDGRLIGYGLLSCLLDGQRGCGLSVMLLG